MWWLPLLMGGMQWGQQSYERSKWKKGVHKMRDVLSALAQQQFTAESPLIKRAFTEGIEKMRTTKRAAGTYSPDIFSKTEAEMRTEMGETLTKRRADLTMQALNQYYGLRHGGGQPQMPDLGSIGMASLSAHQAGKVSPIDEYYKWKMEKEKAYAPLGAPYESLIA